MFAGFTLLRRLIHTRSQCLLLSSSTSTRDILDGLTRCHGSSKIQAALTFPSASQGSSHMFLTQHLLKAYITCLPTPLNARSQLMPANGMAKYGCPNEKVWHDLTTGVSRVALIWFCHIGRHGSCAAGVLLLNSYWLYHTSSHYRFVVLVAFDEPFSTWIL
jgi:hypothetical protein